MSIEYSHMHFRFFNFNTQAVAIAEKYGLPMVGNSDAHNLKQLHSTYSLVEAQKTIPAIIKAVRHKRVEVVTKPLSIWRFVSRSSVYVLSVLKNSLYKQLFGKPSSDAYASIQKPTQNRALTDSDQSGKQKR